MIKKEVAQLSRKEQVRSESYNKKHHRRPGGNFWACVILVCAALLTLGGITIAKYTQQWSKTVSAVPSAFCFVSDYLKEGGAQYDIYTGAVDIVISNSDGANTAGESVIYTMNTDNGTLSPAGGTPENALTGTLAAGTAQSQTVTLSGAPGQSCTVTASSTSPYSRTISATFHFMDSQESTVYSVKDYGNYCELIISTAKQLPTAVSWPADLSPDNTNALMAGWTGGTSGSLALEENSTYHLIFFKSNPSRACGLNQQTLSGETITMP